MLRAVRYQAQGQKVCKGGDKGQETRLWPGLNTAPVALGLVWR